MTHLNLHWRTRGYAAAFLAVGLLLATAQAKGGWKLEWSDEFNGTALDESTWNVETAGAGKYNGEQQEYTAGHDQANSNIFVKNGVLSIVAKNSGKITSGRMNSQNKKSFTHGRMEARMRLPISMGMWPAFWMLGTNGGWPSCGELDIMEGKGRLPQWTSGSYHYTNYDVFNQYTLPTGNVHDAFHTYAAEWSTDSIRWIIDNVTFGTLTKAQQSNLPWDKPFYFIFNLAVGGNFDGNSNGTTVYPESLIVDYVRVSTWDPNVAVLQPPLPVRKIVPTICSAGAEITVSLAREERCELSVAAVNGKTLCRRTFVGKTLALSTRSFAPGVYCVTATTGADAATQRIVISR